MIIGYIRIIFPLTLVYLCLTANLHAANVTAGLLLSTFITWLIKPPPYMAAPLTAPLAIVTTLAYLAKLIIDTLRCDLAVSKLLLSRRMPIAPGIIAIRSVPPGRQPGAVISALAAHAITLTPGELVLEIADDGTLYTHTLNAPTTATDGPADQAARLASYDRIFPPIATASAPASASHSQGPTP